MPTPTNHTSPAPLDYPSALPRKRRFSFSLFVTSAIFFWGIAGFFFVVVPKFKEMYGSYKLQLPAATSVLLSVGDLVTLHYGWVALLVLPFLIALLVPRTKVKLRAMRLAISVCIFLLVIGAILTLFMPMITLIDSLSTAPGGKH